MSNNKQSSVEKMFQEMLGIQQEGIKLTFDENLALLEKYKAMHQEEMINFTSDWYRNGLLSLGVLVSTSVEEHYNKTFNQ